MMNEQDAPKDNGFDSNPEGSFQLKHLPFVNMAGHQDENEAAYGEMDDSLDSTPDFNISSIGATGITSDKEAEQVCVADKFVAGEYGWGGAPALPPYQANERFYSETILNKKHSKEISLFRPTKFAVLVAVFFLFGGMLLGVGMALISPSDPGVRGAGMVVVPSVHRPRQTDTDTLRIEPFQEAELEPAQQFRIATAETDQRPSFNTDYIASALTVSNHIVELVAYVEPSVAAISTTGAAVDLFAGIPFRMPDVPGNVERILRGSGSGILFAEDDERVYIVTNAHVIEQANSVNVSVKGSAPVTARLVGTDPEEDLAVISIMKADFEDAGLTNWSLARFGNSDDMQIGQMVIAIGNAMGGGNTATNGVISGRQQQIIVEGREYTVLQTNAAINPGNSGGPLVNMAGEVIGINTAKISNIYNVEGMGYSITSNVVVPVIERFMNGISNRAFLGIEGRTIPREVAEAYSLPEIGVFVTMVFSGSPAQAAGLERGDIITSIDGETVLSMEMLQQRISSMQVGTTTSLRIIRNGNSILTLTARLDRLIDTGFN